MTINEILSLTAVALLAENAVAVSGIGADEITFSQKKYSIFVYGVISAVITAMVTAISYPISRFLPIKSQYFLIFVIPMAVMGIALAIAAILRAVWGDKYEKIIRMIPRASITALTIGVSYAVVARELTFRDAVITAVMMSVGAVVTLAILSSITDNVNGSRQPAAMRGLPTVYLTAALIALVLGGFAGLRI